MIAFQMAKMTRTFVKASEEFPKANIVSGIESGRKSSQWSFCLVEKNKPKVLGRKFIKFELNEKSFSHRSIKVP